MIASGRKKPVKRKKLVAALKSCTYNFARRIKTPVDAETSRAGIVAMDGSMCYRIHSSRYALNSIRGPPRPQPRRNGVNPWLFVSLPAPIVQTGPKQKRRGFAGQPPVLSASFPHQCSGIESRSTSTVSHKGIRGWSLTPEGLTALAQAQRNKTRSRKKGRAA